MKKIGDFFLSSGNHRNEKERLDQFINDYKDCAGIFTNLDKKDAEKILRNFSATDESSHPAMNIPMSFIFNHPPFYASQLLSENHDGKSLLNITIDKFLEDSYVWLNTNRNIVLELFSLCPDIEISKYENYHFVKNYYNITPKIEKLFLDKSKNRQDKIKRIKVLAALNAQIMNDLLGNAIKKSDAQGAAFLMFMFARSMAQFSSNKAVEDGLDRQKGRKEGGEKKFDREGLKTLIQKYHDLNPNATDKELWKRITTDFIGKNTIRPCRGYSVRFEFEPTDDSDFGGRLIQKNGKGKEHPMGFEAFKNARSEVRK